jgi:uncharacterized protein YcbX
MRSERARLVMVAVVHELAIAVLKGGRLAHPAAVEVGRQGIADDRRFFVIAVDGRQGDARRGALTAVAPTWDAAARRLVLEFPQGSVADVVRLGERVEGLVTWDGNRPVPGREVLGPWSAALSDHLHEPVRLVERLEAPAVDVAPLTIVSTASVARLEGAMGVAGLGARRFRMTLTLAGVGAHEERTPATPSVTACAYGGLHLKGIVGYRPPSRDADGAFVERPGRISVGDAVALIPPTKCGPAGGRGGGARASGGGVSP